MDKDIIASYENLYAAYKAAKQSKRCNADSARFQAMALEGLHILKRSLEDQTYRFGEYNRFMVYEPKERMIEECEFKDKIVQHSLSDNVLRPRLEKVFVRTNYAGQIGKGNDFALDCLKEQMLGFYERHGLDGWFLKCDIHKFYYSIDHDVMKDVVDYYFDDEFTVWLNHLIIDSTDGPGMPLGNQAVMMYALLLLNAVDRLIIGELGIEYSGRYSDDIYLIHQDKEYLKFCLENIEEMVKSLKLELNGKTQLIPFRKGIRFLGFHHYITKDGKYIRRLAGDKKQAEKKRIRRLAKKLRSGEISREKFFESYLSWRAHAMKGNCSKLCHSMDLFVEGELKR